MVNNFLKNGFINKVVFKWLLFWFECFNSNKNKKKFLEISLDLLLFLNNFKFLKFKEKDGLKLVVYDIEIFKFFLFNLKKNNKLIVNS